MRSVGGAYVVNEFTDFDTCPILIEIQGAEDQSWIFQASHGQRCRPRRGGIYQYQVCGYTNKARWAMR